jgi:hypothetical protein
MPSSALRREALETGFAILSIRGRRSPAVQGPTALYAMRGSAAMAPDHAVRVPA